MRLHSLAGGAFLLGAAFMMPDAAFAGAKPSFDCAKASTPIEKAICQNDSLAALDNEIAASFHTLRGELDGKSLAALVEDQRWFVGVRDHAEETDQTSLTKALSQILEPRAKFLRAINTHPANGFAGDWYNLAGGVIITAAKNGIWSVAGNAAEPTSGRWICDFDGTGKVSSNVLEVKEGGDTGGGSSLRLTRVGAMLHVQFVPAPGSDAVTPGYCGANGSLEGDYFAVPASYDPSK